MVRISKADEANVVTSLQKLGKNSPPSDQDAWMHPGANDAQASS